MRVMLRPAFSGLFGLLVSWQTANAELLLLLEGDVDSGAVAVDSSGKGNHGIYLGSASGTADGKTGGALNFNADESYAVLNLRPWATRPWLHRQRRSPMPLQASTVRRNSRSGIGWLVAIRILVTRRFSGARRDSEWRQPSYSVTCYLE